MRRPGSAADDIKEEGRVGMTIVRGRRFSLTPYGKPAFPNEPIELADVEQDPGETPNLAMDPHSRWWTPCCPAGATG